jgi:hypothetical protein
MERIQLGHEVLSLFGMANPQLALSKRLSKHRLLVSLVSAFFIVLMASWVLSVTVQALGQSFRPVSYSGVNDRVAFQPSQAVSVSLSQGYLSQ